MLNKPLSNTRCKHRRIFLTDGGLETYLLFHEGWDLPEFAAFPLLASSSGRKTLCAYYQRYLDIAQHYGTGFVLSTPTWRASSRWGEKLGFSDKELHAVNVAAVELLRELGESCSIRLRGELLISGQIGPYDDAYNPTTTLGATEAERYHQTQIQSFAAAGADQIEALTLSDVEEAIGIVRAASSCDMPVIISFTVETDGCLASGTTLADAITAVDTATQYAPAHYMINCAHAEHFRAAVSDSSKNNWQNRVCGLRTNASRLSHEQLDNAECLDDGDVAEFGKHYRAYRELLPNLWVLGGCCGTDHRHIEEVARVCSQL